MDISLHLTDLRDGAAQQFHKAWERRRAFDANLETLKGGLSPIFSLQKKLMLLNLLLRSTSAFPSMWLSLLVRKHQRMRNYKKCRQQYLPTNISSSRVVSKISKHKSFRFVLWEISYTREFVSLSFVTIRDEEIAKRR